MSNYLISRFLIIFLIKFFYFLILNIGHQTYIFFDVRKDSALYYTMIIGIGIIVIIIAVIIINVIYTFIRISELKGFNHTVKSLDKNHFLYFRDNFISIWNENFNYECDREKFVSIFLFTGIIFLFFVKEIQ